MKQLLTTFQIIKLYHWRWLGISIGFTVLYYILVLLFTVVRFQEIPNYVAFENVFHVYHMVFANTPSFIDALSIIAQESFFETGFKDPHYYGIATWSFSLVPPKMLVVFVMSALMTTYIILKSHTKQAVCLLKRSTSVPSPKLTGAAGLGTMLVSLTNITLSWVACCATPNWSVALTMLGLSSSISLWLNPYGTYITIIGLVMLVSAIVYQARYLTKINPLITHPAN